jgi:hypothetical protein
MAEVANGINPIDDIENKYDQYEKQMLKGFFEFVERHMSYFWLHWNMRDENYGFYAIENRYRVLGGKPISVPDDKKIDIARLLVDRYGKHYIAKPRITKLVKKNRMTMLDFLSGAEEAAAFENKEYIKLHKSTLRKVDLFTSILYASAENSLLVDSKWKEIYGISPQSIFEYSKERWQFFIITNFITLILGALLGRLLK